MANTAEQVRTLRINMGLSQVAFAEKVGVTVVTLSGWENGKNITEQVSNHLKLIKKEAGIK